MALSHAAKDLYQWRRFFRNLTIQFEHDFMIQCDNQQTIRLMDTSTPKLVTKLKHIDIHQHQLRQEVQEHRLQIEWIPTSEMPADGLTKALPRQKHEEFVRQLQLVDISTLLSIQVQAFMDLADTIYGLMDHITPYGWSISEKALIHFSILLPFFLGGYVTWWITWQQESLQLRLLRLPIPMTPTSAYDYYQ